jgi:hypothetical protein
VPSIAAVQPLHVAAWIEQRTGKHAVPIANARLTALRQVVDRLVAGQGGAGEPGWLSAQPESSGESRDGASLDEVERIKMRSLARLSYSIAG